MSATRTHLEHGGITTAPDEISVALTAASYTHPALPGRTVVRLVPEPLLSAEDLSLAVVGLEPQGHVSVGHTRRRAVGFPAWPILNDPGNAQHALNLVSDLERAARVSRSSPKKAKDMVMELADTLDASAPHFLPTFLEEAARIFLAAENTAYATQMYSKARDAERRHSLLIDEHRHLDVLMEFVYAGAVSAKELSAEAKGLAERLDPEEAYRIFRDICIGRVRRGLAPYSGMKKDLATLAKAAGLTPAEEEAAVAAELLRTNSIEKAGENFWDKYNAAIRRAVKDDEDLQELVLGMTPGNVHTDTWLDMLADSGALELVKDGNHPDFVPRIVTWESARPWRQPGSEKLAGVLKEVLPHAGCTSVSIRNYRLENVSPEALEELLANGVSITLVDDGHKPRIELTEWGLDPQRTPLPHLAADETLRNAMVGGILDAASTPEAPEELAAEKDTHDFVVEVVAECVDKLEGAAPNVDRLIEITEFARQFEDVSDPAVQELLDRVRSCHADPAEVLAETLRRGVPEELAWPEFEETCEEFGLTGGEIFGSHFHDCWPGAIVCEEKRAVHLRGGTVTDIPNWAGAKLRGAAEADGQYALVYLDTQTTDPVIWWAAEKEGLKAADDFGSISGLTATVPVPGGRLCAENTVIRPGQPEWSAGSRHFFVEGDRVWLATAAMTVEIDPGTGETGQPSLPGWFEEQCRLHPDLVFDPMQSQLRPVTEETAGSPFSTADGYHRHAVFTRPDDDANDDNYHLIIDADGTEYAVTGPLAGGVCGVLRRPGGGTWILTKERYGDTAVLDPADGIHTLAHGMVFPTEMWWHHTRVRDADLSERLRGITAEDVRPLIDEARPLHAAGKDLGLIVGERLGLGDTVLRTAAVKHLEALLSAWPQKEADPAKDLPGAPHLEDAQDLLAPVLNLYWGATVEARDVQEATAKLGLHNCVAASKTSDFRSQKGAETWAALLGNADALVALAAIPGRTVDEVQGLKELWVLLRETGALDAENLTVDELVVPDGYMISAYAKWPALVTRAGHGDGTIRVVRSDGGGPITVDGIELTVCSSTPLPVCRTDVEPVFDALIEKIASGGPQQWSAEPGEAFAAASGASAPEAHLIMAGFPNFHIFDSNFLPKDLRSAIGLKVAEAANAKDHLQPYARHFAPLLAAGVPQDAHELAVSGRLDVDAMARYWVEHGPEPKVPLPADLLELVPKTLPVPVVEWVVAGEQYEETWAVEVAALLWLAGTLDMSDPLRPDLADYADRLDEEPTGIDAVDVSPDHWNGKKLDVRRLLGLPAVDKETAHVPAQTVGAFTVERKRQEENVIADLTSIADPDDPELALARDMSVAHEEGMQEVAAANLRVRGALKAYARWLREAGGGDPHDPLAVAPHLVAEAAAELSVDEDAARYYLQLLAWPDPTDANVRRWNGWKKADITRAGTQLIDADVAVEGKRPRAGRSFFLHGGWSEAQTPHLPLETWKVDSFQMVAPGLRSKLEPMLGVAVAPAPPPEWFATCWERSRGDDAPRFAELKTTRRRR